MKYYTPQLFIIVLLIFSVFSCSENSNSNTVIIQPLAYSEQLNVAYGDHERQVYDLYLPENRTLNTKVLILVHGGGWTTGDKVDMNGFKDFIRLQLPDIAIVNINYRLADQDNLPFPMQINDITSVVNHLKTNSNNYVISNQLGFIGVSAGAHLSLLWSYAYDTENDINMVCSIVGPTNFTDPAYLESQDPLLLGIINTFGIDTSTTILESVSPYHQATATSAPTILFYGGMDPLIPTTQGTFMRDKLDLLGVTNQFILYPNEGHGWVGANLLDTSIKLKAFIELHL
ncbi:MAG: alpha/beta hydrolase [Olleya sp.]